MSGEEITLLMGVLICASVFFLVFAVIGIYILFKMLAWFSKWLSVGERRFNVFVILAVAGVFFPPLLLFTIPFWIIYMVYGLLIAPRFGTENANNSSTLITTRDYDPDDSDGGDDDDEYDDRWDRDDEDDDGRDPIQEMRDFWGL